jgi:hypothetical protein
VTGPMLPSGVESNVEQYLKRTWDAPSCSQPGQRLQALAHRLGGRDAAGLQGDHDGIRLHPVLLRHADGLHRSHAGGSQGVGQVGRPGEVVRNATKQHRRLRSELSGVRHVRYAEHACVFVV